MKDIKEFKDAMDAMLYLRKEEGYDIGWDLENAEPIPSGFGEKWRKEVTDSDGSLKEELFKGKWTEYEDDEYIYHEIVYEKNSVFK